jgi:hypothetical protein
MLCVCHYCGRSYSPRKGVLSPRFCNRACRVAYHNRERTARTVQLPEIVWREVEGLAQAHECPVREMVCRILRQATNPDGRPLEDGDIYGRTP